MNKHGIPDGFYYREINDGEIARPLMKRGDGMIRIFYKLKKFRDERKWREDINVLANIGWDSGNQFFRTHELLGELDSEKMRFRIDDLQMSLGRVHDVMQEDYWACVWETNKKSNDFYHDTLVRPMLNKLNVDHLSMEQGDMIQFRGMTFVLFDEAIYDNKGTGINNLLGYKQRWGNLIRTTDEIGEVKNVTLYAINS